MTCQCVSPNCGAEQHTYLECRSKATRRIRSRDWGEAELAMCFWCGARAVMSGIFEANAKEREDGER